MSATDDPPAPAARGAAPLGAADLAWLLVALAATAAVFATGLRGELVYDDLLLIGRNPWISDLANLPDLFRRPYWDFLDPGTSDQIGYWRPLTAVVQSLAWAAGGGEPWSFHAASLLLHLGATAFAFLVARQLGAGTAASGAAALLFGIHPVHVESVAWISALNDPLFGFFALLSLWLYLRWRQRPADAPERRLPPIGWAVILALIALGSLLGATPLTIAGLAALPIGFVALSAGSGALVGSAVAFLLALLAKEMALATLLLLPVVELALGRRETPAKERWLEAGRPFATVLALYLVSRMLVFGDVLAGFDRVTTHFGVDTARLLALRLEILGGALGLLAWPVDLRTFRPFRPSLEGHGTELALCAVAVLALVVIGVVLWRRRERVALVALALVPLGLAPTLVSVDSLGRFPLSDRFLYLSVLGFTLLLGRALFAWLPRFAAGALALGLATFYGHQSLGQVQVWRNEQALFENAVEDAPRSAYLRWGLGRVYLNRLAATGDERYLPLALASFEAASDLLDEAKATGHDLYVTSDDFLQTNLGLAHCYSFEAQLDDYGSQSTALAILEALEQRMLALRAEKEEARRRGLRNVEPNLRLELVYAALGNTYRLAGREADALAALEKALELDPRCVEALAGMGNVHFDAQRFDAAAEHLERVLALQPGDFEARLLLAQSLRESGERERAEALATELAQRRPQRPEPYLIVATNRLEAGRSREALTWIDRALAARNEEAHAWFLKAMALSSLGVEPQATIEAFQRATEHDPEAFLPNYNYGMLLLSSGAAEAAAGPLMAAYRAGTNPEHLGNLLGVLGQLEIDSADALFALAQADGERDRLNEAELWLDRALERDPEHADSLFQKGRLYRQRGRHEEALAAMGRACARLAGNLAAYTEYGDYLRDQGRLVEAQRVLSAALAFERPAGWEEQAYEEGLELVRRLLAKIEEELPPSNAIGPPAASQG